MKVLVFVLALLGGILGTLVSLFAVGYAVASTGAGSSSGRFVLVFGSSAILGAVAGVACGALYLAGKWPRRIAVGLAVAAIWHIVSLRIISISLFGMIGGLLMLLAALIAIARELLGARAAGAPKLAAGTETPAGDGAGRR